MGVHGIMSVHGMANMYHLSLICANYSLIGAHCVWAGANARLKAL